MGTLAFFSAHLINGTVSGKQMGFSLVRGVTVGERLRADAECAHITKVLEGGDKSDAGFW